jgi:ABC-type nitrate/sulfonate/bicarbonate transport system permease component
MAAAAMRELRRVYALVPLAIIVAIWDLMVRFGIWNSTIVPSPKTTIDAIREFRSVLWRDTGVTLTEVVIGFLVTTMCAMGIAIWVHIAPRVSRGVYSLLIILQSIPVWGIAPIIFYWAGAGLMTRIIVIILIAFFPVLVNTVEGLRTIDHELVDVFDSMNATVSQKLVLLELPNALHMVIAGSKITLTMCLIGAMFAEMLVGDMVGLGYRIREANAHFRIDLVFASVAVMSVMIMVLYGALAVIERRLQPWRQGEEA